MDVLETGIVATDYPDRLLWMLQGPQLLNPPCVQLTSSPCRVLSSAPLRQKNAHLKGFHVHPRFISTRLRRRLCLVQSWADVSTRDGQHLAGLASQVTGSRGGEFQSGFFAVVTELLLP